MKRRWFLVLTVGIVSGLVVPARAAPPTDISIRNRTYQPSVVQVGVGTNVRWTNDDTGILMSTDHTVTADDGSFDSGRIAPGGSFHLRFTRAGTFAYHCQIHSTMHGTI